MPNFFELRARKDNGVLSSLDEIAPEGARGRSSVRRRHSSETAKCCLT